jgi:hypothetical protein
LRLATLFVVLVGVGVGAAASPSPASAASCPTQTFLQYNHLAYVALSVPSTVQLSAGSGVGQGTLDEPTTSNGCRRRDSSVQVLAAGSIDPHVAVMASGRPQIVFVIGHRCAGFLGSAFWDCLTRPLAFDGQQFTGTSYPSAPAPRKTVPLGPAIGAADYQGQKVTVHRIEGVDPSLAVGISGEPSAAFLGPRTCPYPGFSNIPEYDDLLRCLRGPVWFTFDPAGSEAGGTVVARADRALSPAVAGASISLLRLGAAADFVPSHNGPLNAVAHVSEQVPIRVPTLPAGLYEAVVSCPACASGAGGGGPLYPAGSILVTSKPKTSIGIRIVSYALLVAVLIAGVLAFRAFRRRRPGARSPLEAMRPLESFLLGPGRGKKSWDADASPRPPGRNGPPPSAPRAERPSDGRRRRKSAPRRKDH